jgi:hypothetical protein
LKKIVLRDALSKKKHGVKEVFTKANQPINNYRIDKATNHLIRVLVRASDMDPDQAPVLQDANKGYFFQSFSANYFLKIHLHNFLNTKSHTEVTKHKKSKLFLLFFA